MTDPRRHPSDVRKWIRDAVTDLNRLAYNWDGKGGLPIRGDVFRLVRDYLAGETPGNVAEGQHPILNAFANTLPIVQLEINGTVTIVFRVGLRTLRLRCLCHGVIAYQQLFDDGRTQINGVLPNTPWNDRYELSALLQWLKEGT